MSTISVIVPVYKVEKYLKRCIDSILNQTFKDFDLILVDDGSPDNCPNICDEYAKKDTRIFVIHKENGGLSDARNTGIEWALKNSNSEWLTFIDSDDWVHFQYLDILYNVVLKYDVLISSCAMKRVKEDLDEENDIKEYRVELASLESLVMRGFTYDEFNIAVACGRLYKKELWREIRFPFGRLHEDEFTTHKLLCFCKKIAVISEKLYFYFQNDNGIMGTSLTSKRLLDQLEGFETQVNIFLCVESNLLFNTAFKKYCIKFGEFEKKVKGQEEFKKIVFKHKGKIKRYLKKHKDRLSVYIRNCGYKKWISGKVNVIEGFKKDIEIVRSEKGRMYSILWAIKNKFNYK